MPRQPCQTQADPGGGRGKLKQSKILEPPLLEPPLGALELYMPFPIRRFRTPLFIRLDRKSVV